MNNPRTRPGHTARTSRLRRISDRQILTLVAILALCFVPLGLRAFPGANRLFRKVAAQQEIPKLARLGRNSARGNPAINSSNARAVLTSYAGPENLRLSLEQNQAAPLSLATADFDEDGVPDLVTGYSHDNRGIVSLLRGNIDSIYPNSPEAKQRAATNSFTHAPFISPAQLFDAGVAADFVGSGDFDADGHWDVVVAARGNQSLSFLRGDGHGSLADAGVINLPGAVTALITGEINRADGLTDVIVAIKGGAGAEVLVFEGPSGALKASPESFPISAPANSLALGQLSSAYTIDLAVAAGPEMLVVFGRDRELSLAPKRQKSVGKAVIERRLFPQALKSLAVGEFDGIPQAEIAVLLEGGGVHVLSRGVPKLHQSGKKQLLAEWNNRDLPSPSPGAERLFVANASSSVKDDLLLLDSSDRQLHLLQTGRENRSDLDALLGLQDSKSGQLSLALESSETVAVLPMHLDTDALTDLVILQKYQVEPNVILTSTASFKGSAVLAETLKSKSKSNSLAAKDASRSNGLPVGAPQKSQGKFVAKGASTQSMQRVKPTKSAKSIRPLGDDCPPSSITLGQTINGTLATTDCFLDDGNYVDLYTFTGTNGQQVSITLDSEVFDTYLYLLAPDGSLLASDDDGGGGTNSQIPSAGGFLTLPANGTYTIYATSFSAEEVGGYSLSLNAPGGGGACPSTEIFSGQGIAGSLSTTDCVFDSGDREGSFADVYTFVGFAGQQAAVAMVSDTFDTYLYLIGPDGSQIDENDDVSNDNTNSRIPPTGSITLPANGVYTIYATSFGAGETGDYGIAVSLVTPAPGSTVVTSTEDSGPGSLRQAILNANANQNINGTEIISFQIGTGARTIRPLSPLPEITDPVVIDGTTQPGFSGTPLIELSGENAPRGTPGLKIIAGSSRVRGLVINSFGLADCNVAVDVDLDVGSGIILATGGNNVIEGNFIGTNLGGTAGLCNSGNGVYVFNSSNNTIGGTTAAARNLISGNRLPGLAIGGDFSTGNRVQGNYVGTNVTGTGDLGNHSNGMIVVNGTNHTIGGTVAGSRNVVSGNDSPGVVLGFSDPAGILVQGNYIGTNAAGNASIPNLGGGILVGGFFQINGDPITATDNTIGGTTDAARNVISGNLREPGDTNPDAGNGIEIINEGSQRNKVQGNYIGLNANGNGVLPNAGSGVFITRAPNNFIGGALTEIEGTTNYIAGNGRYGVGVGIRRLNDENPDQFITGGDSVDIVFNVIGTDPTQTLRLGNGLDGVYVDADSVDIYVNSNVIAFNGRSGVRIPDANGVANDNDNSGRLVNLDLNFIFSNAGRAIDLGFEGLTANDPLDVDGGANLQQNFPNLNSSTTASQVREGGVASTEALVNVNGTMNSSPNASYTMHWYFSSDSACSSNQATSRPLVTGRIPNVTTDVAGNASFTIPLDIPAGVSSGVINCTATDSNGNTSEYSACLPVTSASQQIQVTIQTNPAGRSFTVDGTNYNATQTFNWVPSSNHTISTTSPQSGGTGTQFVWSNWSDNGAISHTVSPSSNTTFTASFTTQHFLTMNTGTGGTVSPASGFFNAGQNVNIGATANVGYNFAGWTGSGPGSFTGATGAASVTMNGPITETANFTAAFNPLEDRDYFVRQNYRDFLDRDADPGGLNYLTGELAACGSDATCYRKRRIGVSAAFFVELEFQRTGYVVYRMHRAAFGTLPNTTTRANITFAQFIADRALLPEGSDIAQTTISFANTFVQRSGFLTAYPASQTNTQFVNKLFDTAGLTPYTTERQQQIDAMTNNGKTRAQVLLDVIEIAEFKTREYNRSFVLMQYFGYLRRDPDQGGYDFWLGIVNNSALASYRSMVCAFITSREYQERFSDHIPRSDAECANIN